MTQDSNGGRIPNRRYRIVFQHGIGAPDYDSAYGMIERIVKLTLGGDTKYAEKVWQRMSFMFDVEEITDGT